jgi:hypothetical protein
VREFSPASLFPALFLWDHKENLWVDVFGGIFLQI